MPATPFFARLAARAQAIDSLLCPGLDPRLPEDLPAGQVGDALIAHADAILESTRGLALCYKPNIAFYEQHGAAGWSALKTIIGRLKSEAPVIVDAKRSDIGSTAKAYARAIFGELDADAVTVSAALGPESLGPFLADPARGVFALLRTSNPGAELVQEQLLATGLPAWRAQLAWLEAMRMHHPGLGYVVGATLPMVLLEVRRLAPTAWLLAPGVGAQGADPARTVKVGQAADGTGLILPISRGIDAAEDRRGAAEELLTAMRSASRVSATEGPAVEPSDDPRDTLVRHLVRAGCVRFGTFTLKSGIESPIYLDLRRLVARPSTLALVASSLGELLWDLDYDHIAALPYAALPIGTAVALGTGDSLLYPRREAKAYGTRVPIEGVFEAGDRVAVLDDVVTRGDSKLEALATLRDAGLRVEDIVVVVDREEGAAALLASHGVRLHAVLGLGDLATRAHRLGLIDAAALARVAAFIARPRQGEQPA